jgi:magnesium transporter
MLDLNIDNFHIIDIQNEMHPSMFSSHENYDVLILRLPFIDNEKIISKSYGYIFIDNSYFFYNKKEHKLIDLKSINGLYQNLNENINLTMNIALNIYQNIETMEDDFYENKNINDFNKLWFANKNDLIRISRAISKAIFEYKKFIENYKDKNNFLEIHFDDLLEHLERSNRHASHALEKLDALYNFYVSTNNEKMNKIMYILTVISGIFLPLNLIVGFFGMNTTSLPFTKAENGTAFVMLILLGIVIVLYALNFMIKRYKQ